MKIMSILALVLAFSMSAEAQRRNVSSQGWGPSGSYKHEITTNLTRGTFESGKACKDCSSGSTMDLGASYLRNWEKNIQFGGMARLRMLSEDTSGTGSSETLLDLAAIGVYNLDSDFRNSIFAKGGLGLFASPKDNGNGFENKLGLFIGAGKRFSIFENVTYTPELRLVKIGDIDLGIQIDLVNFSIVW